MQEGKRKAVKAWHKVLPFGAQVLASAAAYSAGITATQVREQRVGGKLGYACVLQLCWTEMHPAVLKSLFSICVSNSGIRGVVPGWHSLAVCQQLRGAKPGTAHLVGTDTTTVHCSPGWSHPAIQLYMVACNDLCTCHQLFH